MAFPKYLKLKSGAISLYCLLPAPHPTLLLITDLAQGHPHTAFEFLVMSQPGR